MTPAGPKSRPKRAPKWERDPDASEYPEPGSRPALRAARGQTNTPGTRWYTATEVAKLCGVTKSAVTWWARTGKVERVPGRGRWLNFTAESLTRACTLGKIRGLVEGYIG